MLHVLVLMVAVYLAGWVPLGFIGELLITAPSLDMRGAPAVVELAVHGLVAILALAAGWMLWTQAPAAIPAAVAAVVATGAVSIQSLFWTVLPRNVAPGEHLPLALLACGRTAIWLAVLHAAKRRGPAR